MILPFQKFISGDPKIKIPDCWEEWINIACCSALGALADYLITQALQVESATLVSMARGFDIVVAFSNQALFLNEPIFWTSIVGAAIIMFSVVANALFKYRDEKTQTAKVELAKRRMEKEQQLQELEAQHHNLTVTEHLAKYSAVNYVPQAPMNNPDGAVNHSFQMDNVQLNDELELDQN